jgi:hypothetical protein
MPDSPLSDEAARSTKRSRRIASGYAANEIRAA